VNEILPVSFADHLKQLKWSQGDHLVIAGPTKSGKTTLAKSLLERRGYVIGFGVKAHDETLEKEYKGWHFVDSIKEVTSTDNRVMLWPRPKRKESGDAWTARQKQAFRDAYNIMLTERGWTIFNDELSYMTDPQYAGLGRQIGQLHFIGRSAGITMVSLAQRPKNIPLAVMSNSSHAYIAQTHLEEDLKRLGDLGGVNRKVLSQAVTALQTRHDFVYQPALGNGRPVIINTHK
jgi:hypothetical protein